jgi:pimeloyl-ACP methyl ester carboxylesterase
VKSIPVLCALAISLVFSPVAKAIAETYHETPCPFDTSTLIVPVRCGLLTVPENRTSSDSRPITLAVMVAESPNPRKADDPMVYLTGGPGESAIAAMVPVLSSDAANALLAERDWIIMDQRGTGYSVPRLDCNIFGIARIASQTALRDAAEVCRQRYVLAGVDLDGYTTAENAADFASLREAMGIEAWNLFGVSYGTTLALTIMRDYPQGIRSVTLDSTLPPQETFFVSDVEHKLQALTRVFDACAIEPACATTYPDLAERFEAAVAVLNEQSIDLGEIQISGDFLVFALTNTSVFQRDVIQQLPAVIDMALNGDVEALAQLLDGVASGTDAGGGFESDLVAANDGMGLAMNCSRDARFPAVDEQLTELGEGSAVGEALAGLYRRYWEACASWTAGLPEIDVPEPVESAIPTLLLVGEWDPSTPPELAYQTAATLENATVVVFPGQGHSVLLDAESTCPAALVNAFTADPITPLDTKCVAREYPSLVLGG